MFEILWEETFPHIAVMELYLVPQHIYNSMELYYGVSIAVCILPSLNADRLERSGSGFQMS